MHGILNLIRWKNLLMIALVQLLIKYAFLESYGASTSLDTLGVILLIIATVCIAAAGNIINDINDVETDVINKPNKIIVGKNISEKTAYNLFIILNVIGVGVGYYLSNSVGRSGFFSLFVIISVLLYVYSTYLKQLFLIGNLVISILVALSILIVGVFELIPNITEQNQTIQLLYFKTILNYAYMAFILNLIREINKDVEDMEGDAKAGMNTLPIIIGKENTKYIILGLSLLTLFVIGYYVVDTLYNNQIAVIYFLIFIMAPLLYLNIKILSAQKKTDYTHISNILKWIMLFGMLSLLLYTYNATR
ncbi:geranylgeranylglycerol-phosphate geranylgeranyltransferase [Confluentibacter flavum]|uniref:Prenyltransferase n=1 Tax=Confluentibacter flavum TaxID=1909700 RepID=A0A2N3HMN4_9FLAO|nr:geranylgeranylglycerol-phosphate geranylgeranyltransferase [Confluentibacter flavum]PKQ46197.1 prenyltransferase [Confluentibacter flavum]